jgi:DNA repair protein RadC
MRSGRPAVADSRSPETDDGRTFSSRQSQIEILLDAFGSPARVAAATTEQLEAIEGIGRHTALKIRDVLHGKTSTA